MNIKYIVIVTLTVIALSFASPIYAASADVTKIETFIKSIIQVLVTIAGLVAAGFFVWGGVGYITSSGNLSNITTYLLRQRSCWKYQ